MGDGMQGAWKEAIGFLSRWCLLALACISVLVVGSAAVRAASGAAEMRDVRMVLSDAIWQRWKTPTVVGYLVSSQEVSAKEQFISYLPGQEPNLTIGLEERVFADVPSWGEGLHEVVVEGNPYGDFAFQKCRAICKLISDAETVFAIDARLADRRLAEDSAGFTDVLGTIEQLGEVILFASGTPAEYERLRARLQQRYPTIPVVFSTRRNPDAMHSLQAIRWTLNRGRGPRPQVITEDEDLARTAASQGFTTRLITPSAAGPAARGRLTRYASFALLGRALKEETQQTPGSQ